MMVLMARSVEELEHDEVAGAVLVDDELTVVVPSASVDRLRGARLEWSDEGAGGLVLVNPNSPTPEEAAPGVPPEVLAAGLEGDAAVRVLPVLDQVINPSIAPHGGRAALVHGLMI